MCVRERVSGMAYNVIIVLQYRRIESFRIKAAPRWDRETLQVGVELCECSSDGVVIKFFSVYRHTELTFSCPCLVTITPVTHHTLEHRTVK
jgi:hypothetical protein